jgi:hypothetical protein
MSNLVQSSGSVFASAQSFDHAQRVAKALASSDLVPTQYQGPKGVANCLIALNIARKAMGVDEMAVMQSLAYNPRPSLMGATFLISAVNTCGKFSPMRFKKGDLGEIKYEGKIIRNLSCMAYAKTNDGELLEGSTITVEMAISEGWYGKKGSKWPNMTEQMLMYRAASFFSRIYCPEITMGMRTVEENIEIETVDGTAEVISSADLSAINERLKTETVAEAVTHGTETVAEADAWEE